MTDQNYQDIDKMLHLALTNDDIDIILKTIKKYRPSKMLFILNKYSYIIYLKDSK